MKEQVLRFGVNESLIGILSEGDASGGWKTHRGEAALLLNAGLIHHIGPNRIYVKLARRMAGMGFKALRFDFSGIGDSGPRKDKLPADASMQDDARQAMDLLERQHNIKDFICIGLCAGAATACQVSVADPRVKKMILINPLLPKTPQTDLMYYSRYYRTYALFNPHSWLKFILLKSSYRTVWKAVLLRIRTKFNPNLLFDGELPNIIDEVKHLFRELNTRSVRLFLVFSEDDMGEHYLQSIIGPEYDAMRQSGCMQIKKMIGADHLVTPLACQSHLLELITGWLNGAD